MKKWVGKCEVSRKMEKKRKKQKRKKDEAKKRKAYWIGEGTGKSNCKGVGGGGAIEGGDKTTGKKRCLGNGRGNEKEKVEETNIGLERELENETGKGK